MLIPYTVESSHMDSREGQVKHGPDTYSEAGIIKSLVIALLLISSGLISCTQMQRSSKDSPLLQVGDQRVRQGNYDTAMWLFAMAYSDGQIDHDTFDARMEKIAGDKGGVEFCNILLRVVFNNTQQYSIALSQKGKNDPGVKSLARTGLLLTELYSDECE